MVGEGVGFCFWLFNSLCGNLLVGHLPSVGLSFLIWIILDLDQVLSSLPVLIKRTHWYTFPGENKGYRGRRKAKSAYSADELTRGGGGGVGLTVVLDAKWLVEGFDLKFLKARNSETLQCMLSTDPKRSFSEGNFCFLSQDVRIPDRYGETLILYNEICHAWRKHIWNCH